MASATFSRSILARGLLLFVLAAVSLSRSRSASAADPDEKSRGRALLAEGLGLLDNGHAQEALAKFESAYRLVPSPRVLFNMGLAHQALGHDVLALECFEGFLGELPDAPEDARSYAERQVGLLRANVSFVEVSSNHPGAEVQIDAHPAGTLPLKKAVAVQPGPHVVTIAANGQQIFRQEIATAPGKPTHVFAVAPQPQVASGRPWQRTAFWAAAGLSGVALMGGIAGHISYESKSSDYRDLLNRQACEVGSFARGHCEDLRGEAETARTLAWVGYSAAAIAGGAALTFWLLSPTPDSATRTAHTSVTCLPLAGSAGLSCMGRY